MKTFSERSGFMSDRESEIEAGQPPEMTRGLRTGLWNIVVLKLFGKLSSNSYGLVTQDYHVFISLWRHFFKLPMDEFERQLIQRRETFRDFFETAEWNRVYDFFEFVAQKMTPFDSAEWTSETNLVLAEEQAPYRFVGVSLVPVSAVGQENTSIESKILPLQADSLQDCMTLLAHQNLDGLVQILSDLLGRLRPLKRSEFKDEELLPSLYQDQKPVFQHMRALLHALQIYFSNEFSAKNPEDLDTVAHPTEWVDLPDFSEQYVSLCSLPELKLSPQLKESFVAQANSLDALEKCVLGHEGGRERPLSETDFKIFIHELIFTVGQFGATIHFMVERVIELGLVVKCVPKVLKPPVQDPWGERRIGK